MLSKIVEKIGWGFIIVLFLSLLPLINLLTPGLPVTHDGMDHVARIANFYKGLTDGVLVPRWGEFLNWGYGHPVLMFLYPFSSYVASLVHFVGFSYVDSLKIVFALGFVASGLTMYFWAKEQFGEYYAVTASIVYLFAPYRFVDLYVRGAIGEHMAFIFPPLILLCMLKISKNKKLTNKWLVFCSLSLSMLLLSHNAISLMFLPVFIFYASYLFLTYKNYKKMISIGTAFAVGFSLSSFFILPAFFEGKFTLRDIVTGDEYSKRFITDPLALLYGKWNYGITGQFTTQIGFASILGTLLLIWFFLKNRTKKYTYFFGGFLLIALVSLLLTLSYSNFLYEIVTTFKKFQFPWRFLSLSAFAFAVLAPSVLVLVKAKNAKKLLVFTICLAAIMPTYTYWQAKEYKIVSDQFYDRVYFGTTDTGESAPIWSVRFMEHIPKATIEVIDGQAGIVEISRSSVRHSYKINAKTPVRIVENTLYFPGWVVMTNNNKLDVEFQDQNHRGLITFNLPAGNNSVDVIFTDTKFRMFSNLITVTTFLCLIMFSLYLVYKSFYDKKSKK